MMLTIWLLLQALTLIGVAHYLRHLPRHRQTEAPDGVVMLLSVRDDWDGGPALIDRLKAQSASFRLCIATSGQCPAAEALAAREGDWIDVIHAGIATDEGQKVHKLRAALRALRPDDDYIIFIDADIEPPARLTGRLLFPLVRDKADIVTGYRLLLPRASPVHALIGAVEMQLATLPRFPSATMPWGGAMALTRQTAERLDLQQAMAGRLSDDMAIGLAGWRAKLRLRPVRDLLVASTLDGDSRAAWDFGVRQYRHVFSNSPAMWLLATLAVAVQAGAWGWAIGSGGWTAVAIGYGAAWGRALLRARIIAGVVDQDQERLARRSLWWDIAAPFAVIWSHLALQIAAVTSSRIRWGGYDYRVKRGRVLRMAAAGKEDSVQKPAGN